MAAPLTNILNPRVQAAITILLLLMFAGVLFVPAFINSFKVEADTKQTLFTLVTAVVFFFIGRNADSANRDDQTAALTAQLAGAPVAPPIVTITSSAMRAGADEPLTTTIQPTASRGAALPVVLPVVLPVAPPINSPIESPNVPKPGDQP
jgi:hypothetical protein